MMRCLGDAVLDAFTTHRSEGTREQERVCTMKSGVIPFSVVTVEYSADPFLGEDNLMWPRASSLTPELNSSDGTCLCGVRSKMPARAKERAQRVVGNLR